LEASIHRSRFSVPVGGCLHIPLIRFDFLFVFKPNCTSRGQNTYGNRLLVVVIFKKKNFYLVLYRSKIISQSMNEVPKRSDKISYITVFSLITRFTMDNKKKIRKDCLLFNGVFPFVKNSIKSRTEDQVRLQSFPFPCCSIISE
jgi:hypothetical protein